MKTRVLGILALSRGLCAVTVHTAFGLLPVPMMLGRPVITGSDVQVPGKGAPGRTYYLQASTNLASTNWTNIATNQAGAAGEIVITDTNGAALYPQQRFYRTVMQ